jgi:predicted amidohydrolase YtcJ
MTDRMGTIEPGPLANLIVLDVDYFGVPEADIREIWSVLTIVDGKIVHDAEVVLTLFREAR